MANLDDLFEGSFRGAKFLIVSATTTGGRKQVKHEYPYSPKQKIEDLGFRPRVFTIEAIISADPPGTIGAKSYKKKRDDLLDALERGGVGTLSHPFYSNSLSVVARPYTIEEDTGSLGSAKISLEFDFSDEKTNPTPVKTSLPQVGKVLERVNAGVIEAISRGFKAVGSAVNYEAASSLLGDLGEAFSEYGSTFASSGNKLNEYAREVASFSSSIPGLIADPSGLALSIMSIVDRSSSLFSTIPQSLGVFSRFFSFGDDVVIVPPTTIPRVQRNRNNKLIASGVQSAYLGLSYQFAATADYSTIEQINKVQTDLEDQFQKLKADPELPGEIFDALSDMRTLVNEYLEAEKINASEIVPIDTQTIPVSVLAFQYYGAIDNLDELVGELVSLNRPVANDVSFIDGAFEVLTV